MDTIKRPLIENGATRRRARVRFVRLENGSFTEAPAPAGRPLLRVASGPTVMRGLKNKVHGKGADNRPGWWAEFQRTGK